MAMRRSHLPASYRRRTFETALLLEGRRAATALGAGTFGGLRIERDVIVLNTTDNFIQAGYRLFEPEVSEASAHTLYWRKWLR
jgi:hypothetical protein